MALASCTLAASGKLDEWRGSHDTTSRLTDELDRYRRTGGGDCG